MRTPKEWIAGLHSHFEQTGKLTGLVELIEAVQKDAFNDGRKQVNDCYTAAHRELTEMGIPYSTENGEPRTLRGRIRILVKSYKDKIGILKGNIKIEDSSHWWMVLNPSPRGRKPERHHTTKDEAIKEAERIAAKENTEIYVLEKVHTVPAPAPQEKFWCRHMGTIGVDFSGNTVWMVYLNHGSGWQTVPDNWVQCPVCFVPKPK